MDNIEIGKRIKQARDAKSMSQEELGNLLGLNKSTIQRYESGQVQRIKLPILENMAKILEVNPSWLVLKSDDDTPEISNIGDDIQNLTPNEKKLLNAYRNINDEGKEKLLSYATDMSQLPHYKKLCETGVDKEEA